MQDLLDKASAWLDEQREEHLSRSVIYQRGDQGIELPATVGRTIFELDDGAGAVLRTESRDYLVRAAHLVLDGSPLVPRPGDQVHELRDGVVWVYQVMSLGSEPCWRYSDPYGRTLRIHTRQVETA